MSDGSTKGFLLSATLHGAAALLLLLNFVINRDDSDRPKVFELVAGEGDNYMATEAPALGSASGVKVDIPEAPEPKQKVPEPSPPQEVTPAPPPPTPKVVTPTPPTPPPDSTVPNFKKKLVRDVIVAESKAKREIKKTREAEAKKAAADAKKAAEDQKKLTKEEFDRQNKTKTVASANKSNPSKSPKVDVEGIAKGVVGGSTNNKVGGAGGKALKTDNTDQLAGYDALFKQRLRREFEPPPGLSDSLQVEIEFRSNADGTLTSPRVSKTSGSAEFDAAVLDALRRVRMPARPDKKSETIEFVFSMREREG
jgi:colicin import membrane protein